MPNAIINIRGGSGSGKTTVARKFLDLPHEAMWGEKISNGTQEIKGYYIDGSKLGLNLPIYLIGSYENKCGGTDGIHTQEEIGDRIEAAYIMGGHVLVEGLLMSKSGPKGHNSPRMRDLSKKYTWFAFLDTPVDTCVERVLKRRKDAGNDTPFDDTKTLRPGHKQAWKSKVLLDQEGNYNTCWLEHDNSPHIEVLNILEWAESAYTQTTKEFDNDDIPF